MRDDSTGVAPAGTGGERLKAHFAEAAMEQWGENPQHG